MSHVIALRLTRKLHGAHMAEPSAPLPPLPRRLAEPTPEVVASALAEDSSAPLSPSLALREAEAAGAAARTELQAIEAALARMETTLDAMKQERTQRLGDFQRIAVELGMTVASRLVHDRITAGTAATETLVRETVERLGGSDGVTVRLHPDDLAVMTRRLDGRSLFPDRSAVEVLGDPSLGRGDCHAQNRDGRYSLN